LDSPSFSAPRRWKPSTKLVQKKLTVYKPSGSTRPIRLKWLRITERLRYLLRCRNSDISERKHTKSTCIGYIKKRKHTFCSWTFGIVAIVMITVIIVLQTKADFS
uniref:LEM domain containing 1 n=1 Tax=Angiostrongylus costaricensis TaxID=334426 RepID=A0A0R3PYS0_ANGCS